MEALLKEIITYAIFVLIVFFLSYQARDSDSFLYAENIKNTFFRNSPTFDGVKFEPFCILLLNIVHRVIFCVLSSVTFRFEVQKTHMRNRH